jgi:hypothetical protein
VGYLTSSVATIPAQGFTWYIVLLQDDWYDDVRRELEENFGALAKAAGPDVLAVKGLVPDEFTHEMLAVFQLKEMPDLPAIIVTDVPPSIAQRDSVARDSAHVMLFPLGHRRERGQVTEILARITSALRSEEAIEALKKADPAALAKTWRWLDVVEVKPSFLGLFKVDLGKILRHALDARAARLSGGENTPRHR